MCIRDRTCCSCEKDSLEQAIDLQKSSARIKVLGSGCAKCTALENNTKEALKLLGKQESVEHITDFAQIASYGVCLLYTSEFAPFVNVNGIAPGFIGTENELDGYDEQFLKEEVEKIMVNRYGDPQEVAYLVKFLVSKEADFINNTVIRIDGGQKGSC